jgi:hypothetical protein
LRPGPYTEKSLEASKGSFITFESRQNFCAVNLYFVAQPIVSCVVIYEAGVMGFLGYFLSSYYEGTAGSKGVGESQELLKL